jgi:predicted AlkP superfamily pyrophosphatase or phosphodiesterase
MTAQFPSTTSAQVTSIHTGLEVGQTGIYEWFQYEPQVDRIIAPLLFSYAGDKVAESLSSSEVPPSEFFPFETIYQKLQDHKIVSHLVQPVQLSSSPYSQRMGRGAHVLSYFTLQQGLQGIKETLCKRSDQKAYILLYYPDIDSVGHRKGPGSNELEEEVLRTLDLLEKELMESLSLQGKKVALMLSADHGMCAVDPKKTWYVNKEYPRITSFCKKSALGYLLAPAGSCRDLFLHIQEEALEEVFGTLTELLEGRAEVWKTSELISAGLFGSHVSSRFLQRVGDLVILPYEGEGVWWLEKHRFEQHFYGAHGGLSREELDIPFLFARI